MLSEGPCQILHSLIVVLYGLQTIFTIPFYSIHDISFTIDGSAWLIQYLKNKCNKFIKSSKNLIE